MMINFKHRKVMLGHILVITSKSKANLSLIQNNFRKHDGIKN